MTSYWVHNTIVGRVRSIVIQLGHPIINEHTITLHFDRSIIEGQLRFDWMLDLLVRRPFDGLIKVMNWLTTTIIIAGFTLQS